MIAGFRDASVIETDEQVPSSPAGAVSLERRQMSMIFQPIAAWPNMRRRSRSGLRSARSMVVRVIQIRDRC
jgi:ABC-type Fe3+/spermidine/putrescine transport system ATPase subunit